MIVLSKQCSIIRLPIKPNELKLNHAMHQKDKLEKNRLYALNTKAKL